MPHQDDNGSDTQRARENGLPALGLAVLFFTMVAVVATWPLARHPGTHYPVWDAKVTEPHRDQLFTAWILASDARQLATAPREIFESNNFHPFRRTLTFSENLIGLAVLVLPVQYLFGNPVLTDNAAFLGALILGAAGVFLLVRELSGSAPAGLVAGMLVLTAPTHWWNIGQLHMIAEHWTPVALFALARLMRTRQWRWSLLLGVAAAFQAWSSLHNGFFLALALVVGLPVLVVLSARARVVLPQAIAGGMLAMVLVLPLAIAYRTTAWEMDMNTRGQAFFHWPQQIVPPVRHPLRYLGTRLASGERSMELGRLAPWLLVGAGGVAGVLLRRRTSTNVAMLAALAVSGFVHWLLSLGPVRLMGLPSLFTFLVAHVPGFGILRAPFRASSFAYLALCVLAGAGYAALVRRLPLAALRAALACAVVGLVVIENGWKPVPLAPAPERPRELAPALRDLEPGCGIAALPATFDSGALALFRSTTHWRPLVNGYSGFYGIEPFTSYWFLNQFPSPRALAYLWEAHACAVVVDAPERHPQIMDESRALGLATRIAGAQAVVRVPTPPPAVPTGPTVSRQGWRVTDSANTDVQRVLDGDLTTLWEGQAGKPEPDRLTVDMGNLFRIAGLDLDLGHHLRRYLVSYRVEVSRDGGEWHTVVEEPVATPPLASYRADPMRIRQRIAFPNPVEARYQRIGPYRQPPKGVPDPDVGFETWGVAELNAYAPPPAAAHGIQEH